MRVFVYICLALWIVVGIAIFIWNFTMMGLMMNNRVPKKRSILGPRQFSFQTDPADYTEIGQQYRQQAIRAEIVLLAYVHTFILAVVIASLV